MFFWLGEGEPPLLAREGVPPPPGPHPFPQRAFFGRMRGFGDAAAFPAATVPRDSQKNLSKAAKNQSCKKARHSGGLFYMYAKAGWRKTLSSPLVLLPDQRRQKGCSSRQRSSARSERKNRSSPVHQFSAFTAARHGSLPPLAADVACRGREGDPGRPRRAEAAMHRGTPAQYVWDVLPFQS